MNKPDKTKTSREIPVEKEAPEQSSSQKFDVQLFDVNIGSTGKKFTVDEETGQILLNTVDCENIESKDQMTDLNQMFQSPTREDQDTVHKQTN